VEHFSKTPGSGGGTRLRPEAARAAPCALASGRAYACACSAVSMATGAVWHEALQELARLDANAWERAVVLPHLIAWRMQMPPGFAATDTRRSGVMDGDAGALRAVEAQGGRGRPHGRGGARAPAGVHGLVRSPLRPGARAARRRPRGGARPGDAAGPGSSASKSVATPRRVGWPMAAQVPLEHPKERGRVLIAVDGPVQGAAWSGGAAAAFAELAAAARGRWDRDGDVASAEGRGGASARGDGDPRGCCAGHGFAVCAAGAGDAFLRGGVAGEGAAAAPVAIVFRLGSCACGPGIGAVVASVIAGVGGGCAACAGVGAGDEDTHEPRRWRAHQWSGAATDGAAAGHGGSRHGGARQRDMGGVVGGCSTGPAHRRTARGAGVAGGECGGERAGAGRGIASGAGADAPLRRDDPADVGRG
jgi:hypothetical protein